MSTSLNNMTSTNVDDSMAVSQQQQKKTELSKNYLGAKNVVSQMYISQEFPKYCNKIQSPNQYEQQTQSLHKTLRKNKPSPQHQHHQQKLQCYDTNEINRNCGLNFSNNKNSTHNFSSINNINYNKNVDCIGNILSEYNKPYWNWNLRSSSSSGELLDDIGNEFVQLGAEHNLSANNLTLNSVSKSLTTLSSAPQAGSMASITSEQQLCLLYNSQQHSDYIISDYMEKIATRINLLDTELKFAWRALDLLSGEYGKIWARLEKLEKISFEQQSVVNNLIGLIALKQDQKQQHQQGQQVLSDCVPNLSFLNSSKIAEKQKVIPFDYLVQDEQLLISNMVESEQQAIFLNNSAGALLQDIDIECTSKQYNNLIEELKSDTLDALDAVRIDSELDTLDKLLQQPTNNICDSEEIYAIHGHLQHENKIDYSNHNLQVSTVGCDREHNYKHKLVVMGDKDNLASVKLAEHNPSNSVVTLSSVHRQCLTDQQVSFVLAEKNKSHQGQSPPLSFLDSSKVADSDLLHYYQQQMLVNDAKNGLLQEFLYGRKLVEKPTQPANVNNDCHHKYKRTSDEAANLTDSMQNLLMLDDEIFAVPLRTVEGTAVETNRSVSSTHSRHINPKMYCDSTCNLCEKNDTDIRRDMDTNAFIEQAKFFRQVASKQIEVLQADVPIEDTGGTMLSVNIKNNSEVDEEFYKKLNEAYRDNALNSEISDVERLLQQSEATNEHILSSLGTRSNSALDIIREDNEENGICAIVSINADIAKSQLRATTVTSTKASKTCKNIIPTTATTNIKTTTFVRRTNDNKKQKKKKHHTDEMEMLNTLKSALAQAAVVHTCSPILHITTKTPMYTSCTFNKDKYVHNKSNNGDHHLTISSSEDEYSNKKLHDTQDHYFNHLNEDKTVLLDSTGEILLMEINKIQDLQVLTAAQIFTLRTLVKKEHTFFEKIHKVNTNLLLLLLNPITMGEELRSLGNDKTRKFERVMKKLERNIDTLKRLVGNSFDDYRRKYLTDAELVLINNLVDDKEEESNIMTTANKKLKNSEKKQKKSTKRTKANIFDDAMDTHRTQTIPDSDKQLAINSVFEHDRNVSNSIRECSKAHFDYSAHLLRNNSNLDEQLKMLETQEHAMRLKKLHDSTIGNGFRNNKSGLAQKPHCNYLAGMDIDLEHMVLQTTKATPNSQAKTLGHATSVATLYNNDEYIKSLKRSLERHNSMLFLLHLQHPEYQNKPEAYQDILAMDIDGMLLAGGTQSPPPPAPYDGDDANAGIDNDNDDAKQKATLQLVNDDPDAGIANVTVPPMSSLNPFHTHTALYNSGHLELQQAGGSPKQTKSDSGLSSISGLSNWEKFPNSSLCGVGVVSGSTNADIYNPFLNKFMSMKLLMSEGLESVNSNDSNVCGSRLNSQFWIPADLNLDKVDLKLNFAGAAKTGLEITTRAVTIATANSVIPSIISTAIATFSNTDDKKKQKNNLSSKQLQQTTLSAENNYLLNEENLNYIRELSKNMPICSVYESKSIFNKPKYEARDEIQTVDEMLEWDHRQQKRQTPKKQQQILTNVLSDQKRRIPDLLRTPAYTTTFEGVGSGISDRTRIQSEGTCESSQTCKRQLTDRLVYYPTSNSITDYNSNNNTNFLVKNQLNYPCEYQPQQQMSYNHGFRCLTPTDSSDVSMKKAVNTHDRHYMQQRSLPAAREQCNQLIKTKDHLNDTRTYVFQSSQYKDAELSTHYTLNGVHYDAIAAQDVDIVASTTFANVGGLSGSETTSSTTSNVWNKFANFLPENFKLKRSLRYGRSRSLPSGYDDYSKDNRRFQTSPLVTDYVASSNLSHSHVGLNCGDTSLYKATTVSTKNWQQQQRGSKQLGGSFDFSKRFHKFPTQLVQRATHKGAHTIANTTTSDIIVANLNYCGDATKKTVADERKGQKKRSRFSTTVSSFMQKAKTGYRRHSFVARGATGAGASPIACSVSDTEAELPSFTSSDNEGSIVSDIGNCSTFSEEAEERDNGCDTEAHDAYKIELQPYGMKFFSEEFSARGHKDGGGHEEAVPFGIEVSELSDVGKIKDNEEVDRISKQNEYKENDKSDLTFKAIPQSTALSQRETITTYVEEKGVPAIQSKVLKQPHQYINMSNLCTITEGFQCKQKQVQTKQCGVNESILKKSKSNALKNCHLLLGFVKTPNQMTSSTVVGHEKMDYNDGGVFNETEVPSIAVPSANDSHLVLITEQKSNESINRNLAAQQSLDVPGGLTEEDDNRSQHSYRTLSSSRRQSTEDSIDTDDEYFCYELRQLEKLEQQRKAEYLGEAEKKLTTDIPLVANMQLFSQIDQLALRSTTYYYNSQRTNICATSDSGKVVVNDTGLPFSGDNEPDETVKHLMSEVLRELKYVVKQIPAIDNVKLETPFKVVNTKSSQSRCSSMKSTTSSNFERVTKVTDLHSAWQDVNGDDSQNDYSDVEENVVLENGSSETMEEGTTMSIFEYADNGGRNDFAKCHNLQYRQLEQKTQHVSLVSGERVVQHKRFRKRRDRRRMTDNYNDKDNEASNHDLKHQHITSSSYSSEEEVSNGIKIYKETAKTGQWRGSCSSDKHRRATTTRIIPNEGEYSSKPTQNDLLLTAVMKANMIDEGKRVDVNDDDDVRNVSMSSGATLGPDTPAELSEELEGDQNIYKPVPSYPTLKNNKENVEVFSGSVRVDQNFIDAEDENTEVEVNYITTPTVDQIHEHLTEPEKETHVMKMETLLLSHDSSGEGGATQGTNINTSVLGSSKWKLLKTLKERKIEERHYQDKAKGDELSKDREKVSIPILPQKLSLWDGYS